MIGIKIRKKDNSLQDYNPDKIKIAVSKSAQRAMYDLSDVQKDSIVTYVEAQITRDGIKEIPIIKMHSMVEAALEKVAPEVAKSYRDYRDYKVDFVAMLDEVYKKSQSIMYIGDKDNANTDSALVATKRSLVFNAFNKELYKKFFLTRDEIQACNDGYIYIHDMSARRDTMNCCLFNIKNVLSGGFEMGNVWYNEPKTLDTAFDVIGDITMAAASQQYGGFTLPEIDKVLAKYAKLTYEKQMNKYLRLGLSEDDAKAQAWSDTEEEMKQGYQGWEYKFNTVGSSRGDYPFITITFGLGTDKFEKLASRTILRVHKGGQGKKGRKIPVLFPKIVFIYTKELHGVGMKNEDLFEEAIACSAKTMYPDYLSLDGDNHVGDMWRKYGKVVSPMGCVDGKEIITYKWNEKIYTEPFEKAWDKLSKVFPAKPQIIGQPHLYLNPVDVKIYDTLKGFTPMLRMIRNVSSEWVSVSLCNTERTLLCTTDHPLTTANGITKRADQLSKQDQLIVNDDEYIHNGKAQRTSPHYIKEVIPVSLETPRYSYDVSTESEHFEVSGIYSHNCRAFLSPWYERGGMTPADDDDTPVFEGRFNIGAVSLHLPMILAKARHEGRDFYEVLDQYLEMIRQLHIRTYAYLGEMRASTNPLAYCEGGFYGGNLQPGDKIKPLLKSATASFGITALNELQELYNGKSIVEDGEFALEVLKYINEKVQEYKRKDGNLYAIYSTPAESLCGLQITQFRKLYGIIENVSDRPYVSNSFHCHVTEDISPIRKQDLEHRFWNLSAGGRIQYVRYPIGYNIDAIRSLVRRAMEMGFYEGVNLALAYCNDCGHQELEMDTCPVCGSKNLTKIDRMNGYLAYSRVKGASRLNDAKMAEIAERKSM